MQKQGWVSREAVNQSTSKKKDIATWNKWYYKSGNRKMSSFTTNRKILLEIAKAQHALKHSLTNRKYIWGIDPSFSGLGLAIIDITNGDVFIDKHVPGVEFVHIIDKTTMICNFIAEKYKQFPPLLVSMEYPFISHMHMASCLSLYKLSHAIELQLCECGGCLYKWLSPTSMKKFITTHGSAVKTDIIKGIHDIFGIELSSDDMADALCLCLFSRYALRAIMGLNIKLYDINSKQSMLKLSVDISDLLFGGANKDTAHRIDVFIDIMSNPTYDTPSIVGLITSIKVVNIYRTTPTFARFNMNTHHTLRPKNHIDKSTTADKSWDLSVV